MARQTVRQAQSKTQINNFFTSTVIGLPQEVVLGPVLKERNLKSNQFGTVETMQAQAWLSEPAYKYLTKALLKSQHVTRASFTRHLSNQIFSAGSGSILMFLLGFFVCAVCGLVLAYAWSRGSFDFTIFN